MGDLIGQLQRDAAPSGGDKRLCRGTLLSRKQYVVDVQKWGFHDAGLDQRVHMNSKDIVQWTKAIPKEEKVPGKHTRKEKRQRLESYKVIKGVAGNIAI